MNAKVISGEVFGVKGPIVARTPTYFIDFIFEKSGATYDHVIPAGWNSLILCYAGAVRIQEEAMVDASAANIAHFVKSDVEETIKFKIVKDSTRFIMLAGKPLDEPIANYGPFVLNSQDQL